MTQRLIFRFSAHKNYNTREAVAAMLAVKVLAIKVLAIGLLVTKTIDIIDF